MRVTAKVDKNVYDQLIKLIKLGSGDKIDEIPTQITFYTDETEN